MQGADLEHLVGRKGGVSAAWAASLAGGRAAEAPPGVANMDGVWRIPAEEEQDAANDADFYHSDEEEPDSYTYTTASESPNWS